MQDKYYFRYTLAALSLLFFVIIKIFMIEMHMSEIVDEGYLYFNYMATELSLYLFIIFSFLYGLILNKVIKNNRLIHIGSVFLFAVILNLVFFTSKEEFLIDRISQIHKNKKIEISQEDQKNIEMYLVTKEKNYLDKVKILKKP